MNAALQPDFTDLRLSVAGIIFLGGPFQGSDAALFGKWLAQLSGLESTLLKILQKGSLDLFSLSTDFYSSHRDLDLFCFYEKEKAKYFGIIKAQVRLWSLIRATSFNQLNIDCRLAISYSAWKAEYVPRY